MVTTQVYKIIQPNGTRKTVEVDDFTQATYDGYTLHVRIELGSDTAIVKVEGNVKCWFSATMPKSDAFALLNHASVLTQPEIINQYNLT